MLSTVANAAAPSQKTSERFYRPELDVLRLVAFLSIFGFHSAFFTKTPFPGRVVLTGMGSYGMCLFFFLSAYLITELLLREKAKTGTVHIRAFLVRRILRIWPLYFGFIAFSVLLGHFFPRFHIEPARVVALVFLSGNWYMARHGSHSGPSGPLWSISLEEQFYLVWPFLAKFAPRRTIGAIATSLIGVAWFVLWRHSGVLTELDQHIWVNSFVQFQFFSLGALTSLLLHHKLPRWPVWIRSLVLVAGVSVWYVAAWVSRPIPPHPLSGQVLILAYLLMGIGCLCFFLGLLGLSPDLIPRWAVYLGKISYGLYVFHMLGLQVVYLRLEALARHLPLLGRPIVWDVAQVSLALTFTVTAASLSYRFYERRFLKLKERWVFVRSRPR
jgi:peptidoglycan/LPS O-acetylase OafA/YrhL